MGIDIAWDRPSVADIKATGAKFVARYFSNDPTKDLTAGEVQQYTAAGLGIVVVFESSAGRALQGHQAGAIDASDALNERAAVGLPVGQPIYFAVDTDATWAQVQDYADGWATIIPKSMTGPYGGIQVVDGAHAAGFAYGWQTTAWSGGQWSQWANIRQTGGVVLAGNADVDESETPDFGQFPRPEVAEVVTQQDIDAIAAKVLGGMPAVISGTMQSTPVRDGLAFADMWWAEHILAGTSAPSMSPVQAGLVSQIHQLIVQLNQTPKPADAGSAPA